MNRDLPIFLYLGFMIDHLNAVPYLDFYDPNMPGTYFFYLIVGRLFGYSDLGARCADLLYLTSILVITWLWLKELGWKIAWCSAILFGLVYLGYGPYMSLQRDYLQILPIIVAVFVSSSFHKLNSTVRASMIGVLFGLAAMIKPHSAIGFPLVLFFLLWDIKEQKQGTSLLGSKGLIIITSSVLGFAGPLVAAGFYLWQVGGLSSFVDIGMNYWPLYNNLTIDHRTIIGVSRYLYLIKGYAYFVGKTVWLVPAAIGAYISLFQSTLPGSQRRQVLLLIGLTVLYSVYPVFTGKYWSYHWVLFIYFVVLVSSLCFVERPQVALKYERLFPVIILLLTIVLFIRPPHQFMDQMMGRPLEAPDGSRVDEIAIYLKSHMKAGDKVQPLDWTGGAIHAMLIARAPIATPFVYDLQFYHHVSKKYVHKLRKRFIESLNISKPRFIIQIVDNKPWVSGPDTTRYFEELDRLLLTDYLPSLKGSGYVIYERAQR